MICSCTPSFWNTFDEFQHVKLDAVLSAVGGVKKLDDKLTTGTKIMFYTSDIFFPYQAFHSILMFIFSFALQIL